jgi:hypothetical protein
MTMLFVAMSNIAILYQVRYSVYTGSTIQCACYTNIAILYQMEEEATSKKEEHDLMVLYNVRY